MAERDIICTDLELRDRMTAVRLKFQETVPGSKPGKTKVVDLHEDFILDDWKVKGPLPEKFDKDGNLIHQNPVFISGHFRGHVVNGIAGAIAKAYYPGRNPAAVLSSFRHFNIATNKLYREQFENLEDNLQLVKAATERLEKTVTGKDYSYESLRAYKTTKAILDTFGRGELDQLDEEDKNDE